MGTSTIQLTGPTQDVDAIVKWLTWQARRRHARGYPEVGWEMETVEPPAGQYVTRDSVLLCTFYSVQNAASTFAMAAKILLPDGRTTVMQWQFTNPGAGQTTQQFELVEGFLLSITVYATAFSGQLRGGLFLKVGLKNADPSGTTQYNLLLHDYVSDQTILTWPNGLLRAPTDGTGYLQTVAVSNPAAGADFSYTFPANARVWLHSAVALLTTNATVDTRTPIFSLQNSSGTTIWSIGPSAGQAASLAYYYNMSECLTISADVNGNKTIPLPTEAFLTPASKILSTTGLLQGTDQWSNIVLVYELWVNA